MVDLDGGGVLDQLHHLRFDREDGGGELVVLSDGRLLRTGTGGHSYT